MIEFNEKWLLFQLDSGNPLAIIVENNDINKLPERMQLFFGRCLLEITNICIQYKCFSQIIFFNGPFYITVSTNLDNQSCGDNLIKINENIIEKGKLISSEVLSDYSFHIKSSGTKQ